MNRRQFFKSVAGVAALSAGGIALLEPAKTIFLPPRGGWFAPGVRMRELQQYLINDDAMALSYDACWVRDDGSWSQYCVDLPRQSGLQWLTHGERDLESQREIARDLLTKMRDSKGLTYCKTRVLPLPSGLEIARYV